MNEKEKYYVNLWDKQSFVKRVEQRIVYITLVFTYPFPKLPYGLGS